MKKKNTFYKRALLNKKVLAYIFHEFTELQSFSRSTIEQFIEISYDAVYTITDENMMRVTLNLTWLSQQIEVIIYVVDDNDSITIQQAIKQNINAIANTKFNDSNQNRKLYSITIHLNNIIDFSNIISSYRVKKEFLQACFSKYEWKHEQTEIIVISLDENMSSNNDTVELLKLIFSKKLDTLTRDIELKKYFNIYIA